MGKAENDLNDAIMLRASELGHRLWRNNSGVAKIKNKKTGKYRFVRYGVAQGGSDLIGFTRVTITPEMVGQTVAIFTAVENKTGTLHLSDDQDKFLAAVTRLGGFAFVCRDVGGYETFAERHKR